MHYNEIKPVLTEGALSPGNHAKDGENSDRMRCVTERGGHEITPRKLIDQYN